MTFDSTMAKQHELDKYFLNVAKLTAGLSHARRSKVGAVIVKDGRIISTGFNGTPCGLPNECEDVLSDGSLKTKPIVIHAEANAIYFCAKTEIETQDATIYLTLSPCTNCALAIIQSGLKRVVYLEQYRDTSGIELLKKVGIKVEQFNEQNI